LKFFCYHGYPYFFLKFEWQFKVKSIFHIKVHYHRHVALQIWLSMLVLMLEVWDQQDNSLLL